MQVTERSPGDIAKLRRLVRSQRDARTRDHLRAALLALEGKQAPEIALMLGRSRRQVQKWVYDYRDGGIERLGAEVFKRFRRLHFFRLENGELKLQGGDLHVRRRDVLVTSDGPVRLCHDANDRETRIGGQPAE